MRHSHALIVSIAGVLASTSGACGQSYIELEYLPGAMVMGLSPDGTWGIGSLVLTTSATPLRWSAAGAVQPQTWPGADNFGYAISDDALVIAGSSDEIITVQGWDAPGVLFQPGPGRAFGMNGAASVFVGESPADHGLGFAYRRGSVPAMVTLPAPYSVTLVHSSAYSVNQAGTLAVGSAFEGGAGDIRSVACLWSTAGGPPQELPPLPGHWKSSASDLSESGAVVVGMSAFLDTPSVRAVRWVNGVPELISSSPFSSASAISADGRIIVGSFEGQAFVWHHALGVRSIRQILVAAGYSLPSRELHGVRGLSEDGRIMVGSGFNYSTQRTFLWRAELPRPCEADWNGDGLVDFGDYLEFLNDFDAVSIDADLTGDGLVDFGDYLEFLNRFEAGC